MRLKNFIRGKANVIFSDDSSQTFSAFLRFFFLYLPISDKSHTRPRLNNYKCTIIERNKNDREHRKSSERSFADILAKGQRLHRSRFDRDENWLIDGVTFNNLVTFLGYSTRIYLVLFSSYMLMQVAVLCAHELLNDLRVYLARLVMAGRHGNSVPTAYLIESGRLGKSTDYVVPSFKWVKYSLGRVIESTEFALDHSTTERSRWKCGRK